MYSATFIFAKKNFDDAFHRLDQKIAAMAKTISAYFGEEAWENTGAGLEPTEHSGAFVPKPG